MNVKIFGEGVPEDFKSSTGLPEAEEQARKWQELNEAWWESNPMRYDVTEAISHKEFSKEFYEEIDKRFFGSVNQFMPWKETPFDSLIDYESLREKDVLEVGVGNGSNAQLLAQSTRSFTGIDITNYAVKSTKHRLRLVGVDEDVIQMNAEAMEFGDNAFDFIWSWGVIHHSANTRKVLEEIHRVLRPGGEAVIMVYHRSMWNTYIRGGLFYGILKGGFLKGKSLERVIQEATDGALARYYTVGEWKQLASDLFIIEKCRVFGSKSQLIPLSYGRAKESMMALIPNRVGRFITNRPFFGFLLVSTLKKRIV